MSDVLFHSTTVRGKNEFWYSTVLALSVRNLMLFADRVLVLALVRCSSMLIATLPLTLLFIITPDKLTWKVPRQCLAGRDLFGGWQWQMRWLDVTDKQVYGYRWLDTISAGLMSTGVIVTIINYVWYTSDVRYVYFFQILPSFIFRAFLEYMFGGRQWHFLMFVWHTVTMRHFIILSQYIMLLYINLLWALIRAIDCV